MKLFYFIIGFAFTILISYQTYSQDNFAVIEGSLSEENDLSGSGIVKLTKYNEDSVLGTASVFKKGIYKFEIYEKGFYKLDFSVKGCDTVFPIVITKYDTIVINVKLKKENSAIEIIDKDSIENRFVKIYNNIISHRSLINKSFSESKNSGKDMCDFNFDWTNYLKQVSQLITEEMNKTAGQFLYLDYLDMGYGVYGAALDSNIITKSLNEIEPDSYLWSFDPSLLETASRYFHNNNYFNEYILKVVQTNPDRSVRKYAADNVSPERKITLLKKAPGFSIASMNDSSVIFTNDTYSKKIYMMDFWATWCKPCVEEMKCLENAYQKYHTNNFEILSISLDDDSKSVIDFQQKKYTMPWNNSIAGTKNKILKDFEVTSIPKAILINEDGMIVAADYDLRGANLESTLEKIFEPKNK